MFNEYFDRLLRSWILKPLACRESIIHRQDAVQWFIDHNKDEQLMELKKLFRTLPDLEKRLTAVMYFRSQPKEFHALCRSWIQLQIEIGRAHV
jgi:DNA mismatch repair protein MSH3